LILNFVKVKVNVTVGLFPYLFSNSETKKFQILVSGKY
jgi:hypothetical protein